MVTVSEQLRHARESQKLDIYQVSEITKIKTDHIRAIEAGNFDIFSAPVYIRGFVRSYASMLKLDVPRVIEDLEAELSQSEKFAEPPPLIPRSLGVFDLLTLWLSRLNWRISVGVVGLLLFLILAVAVIRSRTRTPSNPLKNLGPGLYQPPKDHSGETLPLPPAPAKR
ncbi:MAG: cytoskeleton protein RodZ [Verrucomicrobiota bacterium]|jgi:cytoskeletal protein RodZ